MGLFSLSTNSLKKMSYIWFTRSAKSSKLTLTDSDLSCSSVYTRRSFPMTPSRIIF